MNTNQLSLAHCCMTSQKAHANLMGESLCTQLKTGVYMFNTNKLAGAHKQTNSETQQVCAQVWRTYQQASWELCKRSPLHCILLLLLALQLGGRQES